MSIFSGILGGIGTLLYYTWWLWAFLILWPLFESTWLFWRQEVFKEEIPFVLLELKIPREIKTSPMAMEQVLLSFAALRNSPDDLREKWWDGEVTRFYSLEIVSFGGEVHFYVRLPQNQRAIIEAAFFSYYPDIEIEQVNDYTGRFPHSLGEVYASGYNVWGTEMLLKKSEAYPIKSYLDFESIDEEKQYDPMGVFLEVLGKAKKEEVVAIQIIIQPGNPNWKDKFDALIEELRAKKQQQHAGHGSASMSVEFPHILPVFPVAGHGEEDKTASMFARALSRTPGETDTLKAIEENLARPCFKTLIRYIYLSPKELYGDTYPRRGILSAFNQYRTLDLNEFRRNEYTMTRTKIWQPPYILPKLRLKYKKQRVLHAYVKRDIPPETWMGELLMSKFFNWDHSHQFLFSTRSLATLFHPPTYRVITAPHVQRVESRKAGPPAGLPIYGDEEEMERFK